jgi:hypothetical protein
MALRSIAKNASRIVEQSSLEARLRRYEEDYEFIIDTLSGICGVDRESVIATRTARPGNFMVEGIELYVIRSEHFNYMGDPYATGGVPDNVTDMTVYRAVRCPSCDSLTFNLKISDIDELHRAFEFNDVVCRNCNEVEVERKPSKNIFAVLFGWMFKEHDDYD